MTRLNSLDQLERFRPHACDFIRIYLGVGLLIRGALFFVEPGTLVTLLRENSLPSPLLTAQLVAWVHLFGGLMLALGLLTRLAALAQMPAVLGAVLFVHLDDGLFLRGQSLEFSVLVLCLLGVFATFGAGRLSLDDWMARSALASSPGPARQ